LSLDLYGEIEPYLGFEEQKERLYSIFLSKILKSGAKSVLDIGCGSGEMVIKLKNSSIEAVGIDLSKEMVRRAKERGAKAQVLDICSVADRYEAAIAVFDVLNYIDPASLKNFLCCVDNVLKQGGIFICDINTLYGFEEVAQGSLIIDREDRFVSLDAVFEEGRLETKIDLFTKRGDMYERSGSKIVQYYHDIDSLKSCPGLRLKEVDFVSLFGELSDKAILTFEKV